MTKQLKLSALIVAMAASIAAFVMVSYREPIESVSQIMNIMAIQQVLVQILVLNLVQVRLSLLVLTLLKTIHLNVGKMVSTKMQI